MFQLPTNIHSCILSEWLDVKSLAKLDAAQCNRHNRARYLEVLQSREVTLLELVKNSRMDASILRWVLRRSVRVRKVLFYKDSSVDKAIATSFLTTVRESLEVVILYFTDKMTDVLCRQASLLCPRLCTLHLHGVGGLSGELLSHLLSTCSCTLSTLRLEHIFHLPHFATSCTMPVLRCLSVVLGDWVDERPFINLVRNCPNLLRCSFAFHDEYGARVMPIEILTTLAQSCPKLQTLCCPLYQKYLTAFSQLLQSCPDLHTIDLQGGWRDIQTVEVVLQHCKKLRALRVYSSEKAISLLIPRMHELEHLSVQFHCNEVSTLFALAEHSGNLRSFTLDLDEPTIFVPLSHSAFRQLFETLVLVEVLDLGRAGWLTDALLLTIAAHCKHLRNIAFRDAEKVTAGAITTLIKQCPRLSRFHASLFDDVLGDLGNQSMWRTIRPWLAFNFEHWDSLVLGGAE